VDHLDAWITRISWANFNFQLYGAGTSGSQEDNIAPMRYNRSQWSGVGTFDFKTINSLNWGLGNYLRHAPLEQPPPQSVPAVWSDIGIHTLHDAFSVHDLNGSGKVVGMHMSSQSPGNPFNEAELGAIWNVNTGSQENFFHQWIPPLLRNNEQLKNVSPFLINDNNEIIFGATVREGTHDGLDRSRLFWIHESAKTSQDYLDVKALTFGDGASWPVNVLRQTKSAHWPWR
jgi:hypothetical protein